MKMKQWLTVGGAALAWCSAVPVSAQGVGNGFENQMSPSYEVQQLMESLGITGIDEILASGVGEEKGTEEASFGTGVNYTTIPAASFEPSADSGGNNRLSSSIGAWPGTSVPAPLNLGQGQLHWCVTPSATPKLYDAPVQLPSGVNIVSLRYEVIDGDAARVASAALLSNCNFAENTTSVGALSMVAVTPTSTAGSVRMDSPAVSHTVDNENCTYSAVIGYSSCPTLIISHRVRIAWQRQITPAPATASFGDVPTTHPFFREIEAMVSSGITGGCGGGNYCPDNTLTRAQMAAFLARGLGL